MAANWVDFRAVKDTVSIRMVLEHYGINWLRQNRDELYGRCPIHNGEGKRTFHVNLTKNVFHCFSCGAKGGVLELVTAIEDCSIRDAALKLKQWFAIPDTKKCSLSIRRTKHEPINESISINPGLHFRLRIDPTHKYGLNRGLTRETINYFEAGLCLSKGRFSRRYVFPIHDEHGNLIGYAGRSIDGSEPKYLFPSSKRGFHKRYILFNLHRLLRTEKPLANRVVLVEGFFGCAKVNQAGYPCVAIMGSSLSRQQEELLCRHFDRVILLFDGDDAGKRATNQCLRRLACRVLVKAIILPSGGQPDMLTTEEFQDFLGT